MKRAGPATKPPERAERLGQGAHPQDVDPGAVGRAGPGSSGPRTAWASSSTSRAPWRPARRDQAGEVGHVPVHGEDGVGHDDRPARRARPAAASRCVEVAVGVDGDLGPGQPAAVDDRGVVELVGEDVGALGRRRPTAPTRLAAKPVGKTTARSHPFHAARAASSSAWTGREPVTRRDAPDPAPQRSRARGRRPPPPGGR